MEYTGTWKEIWTKKGAMEGTREDIRIYDGWEKSSADMKTIADRICLELDIKDTDKVLEIGCGAGGLAQYMTCEYIGIDYSKTLVQRCMEFFQKSAVYSEADNLPFKDNYFDKCFSWGVFLYFPDKEYVSRVISEMKRVTKHGLFIGELPQGVSHDSRHMIYTRKEMTEYGFTVTDGWAKPYTDIRFNAIAKDFK